MTCTVAAIIWFLGSMPPKGTTVTVPQSSVAIYSKAEQRRAKRCAWRYGIKWKIEEEK